jgi:hypothetical protein
VCACDTCVSLRAGEDKDWERRREEVEEMDDARAWRGVIKPNLHLLLRHIKCLVDIGSFGAGLLIHLIITCRD